MPRPTIVKLLAPTPIPPIVTMGCDVQRLVVSPGQAQIWFDNALSNRRLSKRWVDKYAQAMQVDEWPFNGHTMLFDEAGRLMDGRHRCAASMQSGCSFESLCVFGLSHDVIPTLDTGRSRSPADVLEIVKGESNSRMLAAALNWLWMYNENLLGVQFTRISMPRATLLDYYEQHQGVREALVWGRKARRLLPPGMSSALCYLMSCKDKNLAEQFFLALTLGENLSHKDGMYLLRDRFQRDWGARVKMQPIYKAALTIKVWNAWRSGRFQLGRLRWQTEAGECEPFPIVQ